jgi:hypothetical protein
MLIQNKALCETSETGRTPQWQCAQRLITVLALAASMITGANAQIPDNRMGTDRVLQEAQEQLAILKAVREASERMLQQAKRRRPKIVAASVLTAQPATQIDFDVSIMSEDLVPPESVLEIRGLPPLFSMSTGNLLDDRSWVLPLDSLSDLKMKVPAEASGRLDLGLLLIASDHVVAFTSLELIIGQTSATTDNPPSAEERSEERALSEPRSNEAGSTLAAAAEPRFEAGGNQQEAAPSGDKTPEADRVTAARSDEMPPKQHLDIVETHRPEPRADPQPQRGLSANSDRTASLTPDSRFGPAGNLAAPAADGARAQAERFAMNGDRYLAQGNIVIARQYYLRAANLGVASAAVKLAATHDPHEMAQLGVVGMIANPDEARRWYQRAALLGAVEAEARLRRLEAR